MYILEQIKYNFIYIYIYQLINFETLIAFLQHLLVLELQKINNHKFN